jgi:hypothetical protein
LLLLNRQHIFEMMGGRRLSLYRMRDGQLETNKMVYNHRLLST